MLEQKYGSLEAGRSVLQTPLRISGDEYRRGLGTHAPSRVRLWLPPAAARLRVRVGIDDNYSTLGRHGSVVFRVEGEGRVLSESPTLRGADPAWSLDAGLADLDSIDLVVTDASDGESHDQADWADARVVLADGSEVWLDDLPIVDTTWIGAAMPFSFMLGDVPSDEVLGRSEWSVTGREPREGADHWVVTGSDPVTGLIVEVAARHFVDAASLDWVLRFENSGDTPLPVLSEVMALDLQIRRAGGPRESFVIHGARGSNCSPDDFEPVDQAVGTSGRATLTTAGGRSSDRHLPMFNISAVDKGIAVALGWSGQWEASFEEKCAGTLRARAGQPHIGIALQPGEAIRSPRVLLVPWAGERIRGHNRLRRTVYEHYTPLLAGARPLPHVQCNSWFPVGDDGNNATAENHIALLNAYGRLGIDYLVMDAGWFEGLWPLGVGNWRPRVDAFPEGLGPIGEAAQRNGIGFGMWFEPERVHSGTDLDREHPDWLLTLPENETRLLNLGIPAARDWVVEMVSRYVRDVPLRYFRHDFNMDPLPYWDAADSEDSRGLTQIRYIEGLYEMWDELHRRFPDLLIEGCASGGRRIDLESLSRCHTYWKSDLYFDSVANQGHLMGAALYLPGIYLNTPLMALAPDAYALRSVLGGSLCLGWDPGAPGFDAALAQQQIAAFREMAHFAVEDFYPLFPHSLDDASWSGWQFHDPGADEGYAVVFRRGPSPYLAAQPRLGGVAADRRYWVRDLDTGSEAVHEGQALLDGIRVELRQGAATRLVRYGRAP